jgi:hypothetical protein
MRITVSALLVAGALGMAVGGCGKGGASAVTEEKGGGKAAPATADKKAPKAGADAPEVPSGNSGPPSVSEWSSADTVNTVGANSAPKDCQMKMVREWLKVNCSGSIKEVTNMEGFGKKGFDYFESITPGKSADLVVRVKKGQSLKARILREGPHSASLFMNWPAANEKPSIIALQIYNP